MRGWNGLLFVRVSVLLGPQNKGWNETFACVSVLLGTKISEMKPSLSVRLFNVKKVCLTWNQIWGMKWNVVFPSGVDSNIRGDMKRSLSVRLTLIQIRELTWNVLGPSVCRSWIPIFLDVSILFGSQKRDEMKRLPVCPSCLDPEISEMKRSLSVCLYWIPIWRAKCNIVCPSVYLTWKRFVLLGSKYVGWKGT